MIIPNRFSGYRADGLRLYPLDMGSDAPDTSRQDAVAERMQGMSEEQWDWVKQQYEKDAPNREAAADMARQVSQAQLNTMGLQDRIAKDYYDYQTGTYRPLEQKIVADAQAFDTPERRSAEAARASADVETQADASQQAMIRSQMRMGVNPNSGKAIALANQLSVEKAKAKAGASNEARRNVELQGYARKMDAASLGRNLPSNQATATQIGLSAGSDAARTGTIPTSINQGAVAGVNAGLSSALGGMSGAASIYRDSTAQQVQASDNSGMWSALGSLGGAALYKWSDKKMKENRKKVKPEASLNAIRNLPDAETYRYKEGTPGDDGGQIHTGHMAQDVQQNMGNDAAPGGKVISLAAVITHNTNAIKALDQRVTQMQGQRKKG